MRCCQQRRNPQLKACKNLQEIIPTVTVLCFISNIRTQTSSEEVRTQKANIKAIPERSAENFVKNMQLDCQDRKFEVFVVSDMGCF